MFTAELLIFADLLTAVSCKSFVNPAKVSKKKERRRRAVAGSNTNLPTNGDGEKRRQNPRRCLHGRPIELRRKLAVRSRRLTRALAPFTSRKPVRCTTEFSGPAARQTCFRVPDSEFVCASPRGVVGGGGGGGVGACGDGVGGGGSAGSASRGGVFFCPLTRVYASQPSLLRSKNAGRGALYSRRIRHGLLGLHRCATHWPPHGHRLPNVHPRVYTVLLVRALGRGTRWRHGLSNAMFLGHASFGKQQVHKKLRVCEDPRAASLQWAASRLAVDG
ncbi:MAG: hypothetical protein BJ554DRAFT_3480 [Olpidium bornovanus]|uniref:Secreted protein n=1 Tax=Olpidium bornovanus TaxID=278681 RepID=A0A8H7ZP27_9FUNG|nr:MAG: hypothetical protein BJ554DRAFT_3480 [Olpidium bornovanus]